MTCIFKIGNMSNSCKHGCSIKRTDRRNGEQNFSFSTLFHNLTDFFLKLFEMGLHETQFLDEQFLFKQETTLASKILCSNALGSKLLEENKLCL